MPPHRLRGHGWPQRANHIDLRYSADALKAISDLQLGSRPRAILKIRPPSSLDYRARHGPQTKKKLVYQSAVKFLILFVLTDAILLKLDLQKRTPDLDNSPNGKLFV